MSSRGYGSLLDFYEYAWELKDKFCRFYKDKKFFSRKEENGVEPFIKGDENVYHGGKRLPFNFLWGLIELLALIAVLQAASYFSHKKALTRVNGEMAAQWDPGSFNPAESQYYVWQIEEEGYSQRMYNHLLSRHDFLYLCHPGLLPGDIRAGDFLYLARQSGKDHYLFHDLTREMPIAASVSLKKRMEALKSRGAVVMLFLRRQVVDDDDEGQSFGIREAETWSEQVERWEENI